MPNTDRDYLVEYLRQTHVALWVWLADNPSKQKEDWHGWVDIANDINTEVRAAGRTRCFCCPAARLLSQSNDMTQCVSCPVHWSKCSGPHAACLEFPSEYKQWQRARTSYRRRRFALKIAHMWLPADFK